MLTTASQTKLPVNASAATTSPMNRIELAGVAQRGLTAPNQRGSEPWPASAKVTRGVEVIAPQILPATEASAVAVRRSAPAGPISASAKAASGAAGAAPAGITAT